MTAARCDRYHTKYITSMREYKAAVAADFFTASEAMRKTASEAMRKRSVPRKSQEIAELPVGTRAPAVITAWRLDPPVTFSIQDEVSKMKSRAARANASEA